MNRRNFATSIMKWAMVALFVPVTFMAQGCSAVTDLENWIPVALTAVSQIVKLLGPVVPAPVSAAIAVIQAAFAALLTTLQNYKKGTSVLSDISNAIAAVEAAFQSFFSTLGVPSGLLSTIEGLAAIILSTIQAFASEIAPTPPAMMAINGHAVPVTPKKRSVKTFRADWNAQCVSSGHPEAEL
jgi:hypothetical protein